MKGYLGLDVGSVSTNLVIINERGDVIESVYLRTQGQPIAAVQKSLSIAREHQPGLEIMAAGTTGSARQLAAVLVGADTVKNEITAHAVAASTLVPGVQTVLEIGGQDSKLIILRQGVVRDFAMNTVCAAGTGSFLDQQAARLGIPIEEFAELARNATVPVRIAGRCAVFAESDMIHKQQMGCSLADIGAGLCEALVRNYLNNLGKGKEILDTVVFQGGVAANAGMRDAFARALKKEIIVPKYFDVMGAVGMAILSREQAKKRGSTSFRGWETVEMNFAARSSECQNCPNHCEVISIHQETKVLARWGDRCGRWSASLTTSTEELAEAR